MRKMAFILRSFLISSLILLSSCSSENAKSTPENTTTANGTAQITTTTTPPTLTTATPDDAATEITTIDWYNYIDFEQSLDSFDSFGLEAVDFIEYTENILSYFQNPSSEFVHLSSGKPFLNMTPVIYEDFWNKIKIDRYKVLEFRQSSGQAYVVVGLLISQSDNKRFPVGRSKWVFNYVNEEYGLVIKLSELTDNYAFDPTQNISEYNAAEKAAWLLTEHQIVHLAPFLTFDNINDVFAEYMNNASQEDKRYMAEELKAYADLLIGGYRLYEEPENVYSILSNQLGIEVTDELKSMINADGYWYPNEFPSLSRKSVFYDYDEQSKIHTVDIAIYADSFALDIASTVRFEFEDLSDDRLRFLSMEHTYSNGKGWYDHLLKGAIT